MNRRYPGDPFFVESEGGLVEIDAIGVPVLKQPDLGIPSYPAVMFQEVMGGLQVITDECLADENTRRVIGIDLLVVDGPAGDHHAVQVQRFRGLHPLGGPVPSLVGKGSAAQVAAQFGGPPGLYPGHRARIEPVGLDHLRCHDPGGGARPVPWCVRSLLPGFPVPPSGRFFLRVPVDRFPSKEAGTGEDHGGAVPGPGIEIAFPVFRDLAEQSTEDRPVDRVVVCAARTSRTSRPAAETAGFPKRTAELHVDIAPFAHAVVGQVVLPAEPAHGGLGLQVLESTVESLPDIEQGQEIRGPVPELAVFGVRLFLLVERPYAGVLYADGRRDHEDLLQDAFLTGLQQHARHRGRHRQSRHVPAPSGQPPFPVDGPQFGEQLEPVPDRLGRGWIEKGEGVDVAQFQRQHAQDDLREIGALQLGRGEFRPAGQVGLAVKPEADASRHASAPSGPLQGAASRYGLDGQALGAGPCGVPADPRETGIDDVLDARYGQRGLGDVRGHDDAPVVPRPEDPLLVRVGQPAEERKHVGVAVGPAFQSPARLVNVLLRGEKHQDVAPAGFFHDPFDRVHRPVDIGIYFGFAPDILYGKVADLHRVQASGDFDDRRLAEGVRECGGVDRRRGDHDLEILPAPDQQTQVTEQEVDVQAAFVGLVDDDRIVFKQVRVVLYLGEQHAVGHHLDAGLGHGLVREPDLASDFSSPGRAELLGDAARDRQRRDAAGLRARDAAVYAPAGFETDPRQLRRLARTGLPRHDDHRVAAQGFEDFIFPG